MTGVAFVVVAVLLVAACGPSPQLDQSTPKRWRFTTNPTFADEFNLDGPVDQTMWVPLVEQRHAAALTDSTRNLRVYGGNLVIEAHQESLAGQAFTSAMVQTKRAFLHGRFESRMKFPTGAGAWPAFWLCCNGNWPDTGEIDIAEYYAGPGGWLDLRSGYVESNLHSSPNLFGTDRLRVRRTAIDPSAWHTYAVEWAPDEIRFYVDDTLTGLHRASDPESIDGGWPFATEPEHLLFDLFLGGPAGAVDPSAMPQSLLVDWVRVHDLVGPV